MTDACVAYAVDSAIPVVGGCVDVVFPVFTPVGSIVRIVVTTTALGLYVMNTISDKKRDFVDKVFDNPVQRSVEWVESCIS